MRAQNWELDPGFALPIMESSATPQSPNIRLAALPDGRVLVLHQYLINGRRVAPLVRLNSDGSVDESYAVATLVSWIVHVYADGRVLIVDSSGQLRRLVPNGSVDASFAPTTLRADFGVRAAATPTGQIWIWGSFRAGSQDSVALALLKPDGGWDGAFSPLGALDTFVNDAAAQADGKLVVAGRSSLSQHGLFRLNSTGGVDLTFDAGATYPAPGSSGGAPDVVAVLADGRIHAANTTGSRRLLSNGAPDPAYRSALIDRPSVIGRATASGIFYYVTSGPNSTVHLNRLNADGTADPSFQVQGDFSVVAPSMRLAVPSSWDDRTLYFSNAITTARSISRLLVARVSNTSAIDPTFRPRFSDPAGIGTVLRQPDGAYLVTGSFDYVDGAAITPGPTNLIRLNANGSFDRSFRAAALPIVNGTATALTPIAVQPSGRILAIGPAGVIRLKVDGSVDETFPPLQSSVLRVDEQGRLYTRTSTGPVQRRSPDGVIDPSFAPVEVPPNASYLPTGGFLVETFETPGRKFTWLRPDGSVSGEARYSINGAGGISTVLPDGSVMVFGNISTSVPNTRATRVYRFDSTGRQLLFADVGGDLMSVAGLIHDALTAAGGGVASFDARNLTARGRIYVFDHEILLLPDANHVRFGSVFPLGRFRPRNIAEPVTSLAPTIFLQPTSRSFTPGGTASFTVNAYGGEPLTYQWFRDGVAIAEPRETQGLLNILTLRNVQQADIGEYTVRITNSFGSTTSFPARLGLLAPPAIALNGPSTLTVAPGQTVALTIRATGDNVRYSYQRDGASFLDPGDLGFQVPGGTYTLLLPRVSSADAGVYRIGASNGVVTAQSGEITLNVSDGVEGSRLINASVRTHIGTGDQSLIVGFVVAGAGGAGQPLLARGLGPALTRFGVPGVLVDPQLTLRSSSAVVATNDNWSGDSQVTAVAAQVGAFPLSDTASRDAALFHPALASGPYTLQVLGAGNSTGVALAELYDASPASAPASRPRLINLSCRAQISAEDDGLIAGFVIAGGTAKTVLVRGIGPTLGQFGVAGFLASGQLAILDGTGRKVAESLERGYNGAPDILAPTVGAFPLAGGANDNVVAITLPPGAYTAHLRGSNRNGGIALIEVYEVP